MINPFKKVAYTRLKPSKRVLAVVGKVTVIKLLRYVTTYFFK